MNRARSREQSPPPVAPEGHGGPAPGLSPVLIAPLLCIMALECSQLAFHGVARPQLIGARARSLLARAAAPAGGAPARLPA